MFFLLFFFSFIVVLIGVHCGIYKGSYNVPTTAYLNSTLSPFPFIPLSLDSWNRFNRYHFCIYIHIYTFFAPYSLSYHLSPLSPPSHWYQHPFPAQDLFHPPVLWFWRKVKKKNMAFLLVVDKGIQGVSLLYFHAYMCYTPNWFIFSKYLHSTLGPFLWWSGGRQWFK
jgi:hypothetical protein